MLSNDKVNINLGCGGWLIPITFIILLIAKVIVHSDISWLIVFSPLIVGVGIPILLIIIWIILLLLK